MTNGYLSRCQAIRILQRERDEILSLIHRLPVQALTKLEIGRGGWSPKDVINHMGTWEGFALEALDAWDEDHSWSRESEIWARGVSPTNQQELARSRRRSRSDVRPRSDGIHDRLIARLEAMSSAGEKGPGDLTWPSPLGERLGGQAGPFRHGAAHLRDLRTFVESTGADPIGARDDDC